MHENEIQIRFSIVGQGVGKYFCSRRPNKCNFSTKKLGQIIEKKTKIDLSFGFFLSSFLKKIKLSKIIIKKVYNKQIFHAFLLNIRNYLPEVSNIQRRAAELNIILARGNNSDIQ